ncbi:MAG TPA: hypothetical protein VIO14_05500 [Dehalococcoidia bacterium]
MAVLVTLLVPALALTAGAALAHLGRLNPLTLSLLLAGTWTVLFGAHAYAGHIPLSAAMTAAAVVFLSTLPASLVALIGWEWYRTGRARHRWNRWLRDVGDDEWWSN